MARMDTMALREADEQVRSCKAAYEVACGRRKALIEAQLAAGMSMPEIGRLLGLTRARIRQIVMAPTIEREAE